MPQDNPLGPPIDVHDLFPLEQRQLLELLRGLTSEQWKLPTACAGWDVKDLAGHLLGDHLHRLSASRDGHRTAGPADGEAFPAFIHRLNDEWVTATRTLSAPVLVDILADASAQVCDFWAGVDLFAPSIAVSWAGPDPAPMWLDMGRDYTEYWVHHQQLREAVGLSALDDRVLVDPVVDIFMRALPYTRFGR
ncbi:maleylpyruvate isomerase family mycothiol-dependent enzyme [Fodinicola feengrottensis]|uniref:maleylpyruvate isomerase family mycothiol-dependent enzyme n=1 Tax=Fodinicola feengrottensis TaxID=435914 RepID=UPI00244156D0|nr:maleylpyruvate isomerase family mycothiol-dependent enzyme [Fodinicola feengrottensis]